MKNSIFYFYIILMTIGLFWMQSCDSSRTPDYSPPEKERPTPEGNRTSDSTIYNPINEPGSAGTNGRPQTQDSSQMADSLSGSRNSR